LLQEQLNKFTDIVFHEDEHKYTYNGYECKSVTTLLKDYKHIFDDVLIAGKYAKKNGLELIDVLKNWDQIREKSGTIGTEVHRYAEMKFLQKAYIPHWYEYEPPMQLLTYVDNFYHDTKNKLIPIKLEFVIGSFNKRLCGMIDKLFWNVKAKELQIWDYKTSKKIETSSPFKNKMRNGLQHLDDCEYNTYSLQLGIYKKIIETECQIKLGNSYICWLNAENDNYKVIKTADMEQEVDLIWNSI
jgi:hypothetical protein